MVQALLNNGLLRMGELADQPEETFSREYAWFLFCPGDTDPLAH